MCILRDVHRVFLCRSQLLNFEFVRELTTDLTRSGGLLHQLLLRLRDSGTTAAAAARSSPSINASEQLENQCFRERDERSSLLINADSLTLLLESDH